MKRKRGWMIVCGILFLLLAIVAVVVWLQWNNIRALRYAQKYTPEQRQVIWEENQEEIQRILEKFPDVHVAPLSEEQEQQLKSGDLSEEDALLIIQGEEPKEKDVPEQTAAAAAQENADPAEQPAAAAAAEKTPEQRLQELFARVYLLRSGFAGRLDGLIEQAKQEYSAKGGNIDKAAFAKEYLKKGTALESACDAEMESLLGQMAEVLKEIGDDSGTIDQIRDAYQNEKSIKKAALMDQYQ